ncbi:MAG: hypothetical protein Q8K99_08825 [Actinomycetota bacterium]|nr:hypothetical protein [Actinomycetota bacterium]
MSSSDDGERYVLDSCVVIDFCGRTDNLQHLIAHVGDAALITSAVEDELKRLREKQFPFLSKFFELVECGKVQVADPDIANETAERIISKWTRSFGAGEVSSAALAASRGWIFVSQDLEPMRQLRLSETIFMETTSDILKSLTRQRAITKQQATEIQAAIRRSSKPRRRR